MPEDPETEELWKERQELIKAENGEEDEEEDEDEDEDE